MNPLLAALRDPASTVALDERAWDDLLRMARPQRLHARLAVALRDRDLAERTPERVQRHLRSYARVSEEHDRGLRWEIDRISAALAGLVRRVVLL
jgi:hypothetical protein